MEEYINHLNRVQRTFRIITFFTCLVCFYYLTIAIIQYKNLKALKVKGIPSLVSFAVPLLFWSCLIFACKLLYVKICAPKVQPYCKNKGCPERAKQFADCSYRSLYNTVNSIFGLYVLSESGLLPHFLGGKTEVLSLLSNLPFEPSPSSFYAYSLFSMAYYFQDFFTTVLRNKGSNDYWEMILHHIVTISLFAGMLFCNHVRMGVAVCFLHTVSDILLTLSRGLSHVETKITPVVFAANLVVWMYMRNYCLVICTYRVLTYHDFADKSELFFMSQINLILGSFLAMLCIMNLYWTGLMWRLLKRAVTKGQTEDTLRQYRGRKEE
jgi:acyl-CoA-dependent ceramide synthase